MWLYLKATVGSRGAGCLPWGLQPTGASPRCHYLERSSHRFCGLNVLSNLDMPHCLAT